LNKDNFVIRLTLTGGFLFEWNNVKQ